MNIVQLCNVLLVTALFQCVMPMEDHRSGLPSISYSGGK